ncbi:DUF1214 domain-containing protein [Paraburkholderia nodosa]|uniref:DUF1214 domain-containing protein n=1 Tax=Paraburkholderia nodosa TaxID=392320 RepID=UPI001FE1F325|nr:DUF1214 domain-containing protein [Paraburkholderia nodosa]
MRWFEHGKEPVPEHQRRVSAFCPLYVSFHYAEATNGTPFSRISAFTHPRPNGDGSIDLYFGPKIPAGQEANWVRTVPGKGWFFLLRLYGPEVSYFDRTWKPDDLVEVD